MNTFNGAMVKKIRVLMDITQTEFANRIGISQAYLAKFEHGQSSKQLPKHEPKIRAVFHKWCNEKITEFGKEIELLEALKNTYGVLDRKKLRLIYTKTGSI